MHDRWKDPLQIAFVAATVASCVLLVLKLCGVVRWNWRWILAPIWLVTGVVVAMSAISLVRWILGNRNQ